MPSSRICGDWASIAPRPRRPPHPSSRGPRRLRRTACAWQKLRPCRAQSSPISPSAPPETRCWRSSELRRPPLMTNSSTASRNCTSKTALSSAGESIPRLRFGSSSGPLPPSTHPWRPIRLAPRKTLYSRSREPRQLLPKTNSSTAALKSTSATTV